MFRSAGAGFVAQVGLGFRVDDVVGQAVDKGLLAGREVLNLAGGLWGLARGEYDKRCEQGDAHGENNTSIFSQIPGRACQRRAR